jgi:hypothetical protein
LFTCRAITRLPNGRTAALGTDRWRTGERYVAEGVASGRALRRSDLVHSRSRPSVEESVAFTRLRKPRIASSLVSGASRLPKSCLCTGCTRSGARRFRWSSVATAPPIARAPLLLPKAESACGGAASLEVPSRIAAVVPFERELPHSDHHGVNCLSNSASTSSTTPANPGSRSRSSRRSPRAPSTTGRRFSRGSPRTISAPTA